VAAVLRESEGLGGVLLLHGLLLSPIWMRGLAKQLAAAGFDPVMNLGYGRADSLRTIQNRLKKRHGARLAAAGELGPVHGVGLSMGGLLLRGLLADGTLPSHPDAYYVTLGTPHHGVWKAQWGISRFGRLATTVYGGVLRDITPESPTIAQLPHLPPDRSLSLCSGTGTEKGRMARIPGDNDGVIATAETTIPDAEQRLIPHHHHYFLSLRQPFRDATVEWLHARASARIK